MGTLYTYKVHQKKQSVCSEWILVQLPPRSHTVNVIDALYYFPIGKVFAKISFNPALKQGVVYNCESSKYEGSGSLCL